MASARNASISGGGRRLHAFGRVDFATHHHIPGDARHLASERHRGPLRWECQAAQPLGEARPGLPRRAGPSRQDRADPSLGRAPVGPNDLDRGIGQERPSCDCATLADPRCRDQGARRRSRGPHDSLGTHHAEGPGIATGTTAEMLILVGDNPHRIRSEAALAKLNDVDP